MKIKDFVIELRAVKNDLEDVQSQIHAPTAIPAFKIRRILNLAGRGRRRVTHRVSRFEKRQDD
jgi:hypothetical protein